MPNQWLCEVALGTSPDLLYHLLIYHLMVNSRSQVTFKLTDVNWRLLPNIVAQQLYAKFTYMCGLWISSNFNDSMCSPPSAERSCQLRTQRTQPTTVWMRSVCKKSFIFCRVTEWIFWRYYVNYIYFWSCTVEQCYKSPYSLYFTISNFCLNEMSIYGKSSCNSSKMWLELRIVSLILYQH